MEVAEAIAMSSGVIVPNFTGRAVSRCAALHTAVYCSVPRSTGPTRSGITRPSRMSCRMCPRGCTKPARPEAGLYGTAPAKPSV